MELFIVLVPFGLDVDDSSNGGLRSSSGQTVGSRGEGTSLSGVRDGGNTDIVVASWVKVGDGEGLGVGVQVDPDTTGVDLDGNLPSGSSSVGIGPLDGNGGLSLGSNLEVGWV